MYFQLSNWKWITSDISGTFPDFQKTWTFILSQDDRKLLSMKFNQDHIFLMGVVRKTWEIMEES